jgi:hypothetical protein
MSPLKKNKNKKRKKKREEKKKKIWGSCNHRYGPFGVANRPIPASWGWLKPNIFGPLEVAEQPPTSHGGGEPPPWPKWAE